MDGGNEEAHQNAPATNGTADQCGHLRIVDGQPVLLNEEGLLEHMAKEALEAERHSLAIAMAESLDEDHARKAAERPLETWEDKDLLQRYKASNVLREFPEGAAVLGESCRKEFVDALEFERSALKWYPVPGTGAYFSKATQTALAHAMRLDQKGQARAKRRTKSKARAEEPSLHSKQRHHSLFVEKLSQQVKEAKDAVYGMPDGDIPRVFRSAADASGEDSDVECLEEVTVAKKPKIVHTLC